MGLILDKLFMFKILTNAKMILQVTVMKPYIILLRFNIEHIYTELHSFLQGLLKEKKVGKLEFKIFLDRVKYQIYI